MNEAGGTQRATVASLDKQFSSPPAFHIDCNTLNGALEKGMISISFSKAPFSMPALPGCHSSVVRLTFVSNSLLYPIQP